MAQPIKNASLTTKPVSARLCTRYESSPSATLCTAKQSKYHDQVNQQRINSWPVAKLPGHIVNIRLHTYSNLKAYTSGCTNQQMNPKWIDIYLHYITYSIKRHCCFPFRLNSIESIDRLDCPIFECSTKFKSVHQFIRLFLKNSEWNPFKWAS